MVECASHLGHTLHESGTMDQNARVARAKLIDQLVDIQHSFFFASPVEILRAYQVYCSSHYGSMLWDLSGDSATQYFNSWTTGVKLAWQCPRATRTYLVQQVLACGGISAKVDILSRFCKFFLNLRSSPCREVSILANLVARDVRSVTGNNVRLIMELSGCNLWSDSSVKVKAGLLEAELVICAREDSWRVSYLRSLLQHRQEWYYRGDKDQVAATQTLIDSLCVN